MALVLADRVQQTGIANTTVSFTLSGSVTGFQSFAVIGNINTTVELNEKIKVLEAKL
jgi:hypothetical protein